MRIESCYSLSIEEILTFHDVLILIKIELTFLQEFMLIRQTNQKCTMFATIGIF